MPIYCTRQQVSCAAILKVRRSHGAPREGGSQRGRESNVVDWTDTVAVGYLPWVAVTSAEVISAFGPIRARAIWVWKSKTQITQSESSGGKTSICGVEIPRKLFVCVCVGGWGQ